VCGVIFVILIGAVFLNVGVQSVRGTARDTLGNGIGSILFGLLYGGAGTFLMIGSFFLHTLAAETETAALMLGIFGTIALLCGLGLLAAGVMALVGRDEYKAWRRAEKRRRDGDRPGLDVRR
jgi:hypothetical protein